jgi:hypothetical protein
MYRYYRTHLAPSRSRLFNAVVYCGIGVKFLTAAVGSAVARLLSAPGRRAVGSSVGSV